MDLSYVSDVVNLSSKNEEYVDECYRGGENSDCDCFLDDLCECDCDDD